LQDALESPIYICGMAPLDLDDPCYEIFLCDTTLDCDKHVESEFYVSKVQPTRVWSYVVIAPENLIPQIN
jgi:hypothetical protein